MAKGALGQRNIARCYFLNGDLLGFTNWSLLRPNGNLLDRQQNFCFPAGKDGGSRDGFSG